MIYWGFVPANSQRYAFHSSSNDEWMLMLDIFLSDVADDNDHIIDKIEFLVILYTWQWFWYYMILVLNIGICIGDFCWFF